MHFEAVVRKQKRGANVVSMIKKYAPSVTFGAYRAASANNVVPIDSATKQMERINRSSIKVVAKKTSITTNISIKPNKMR